MSKRVVITGLGVVSSVGIGWQEFWKNILAGTSGISPISAFDTAHHFTHNGGEVKQFRPEDFLKPEQIRRMNRATQMAMAAVRLAIDDAKLSPEILRTQRTGLSLGTTTGSVQSIESINDLLLASKEVPKHFYEQLPPHATPSDIGREYSLSGPVVMFATACAAGNYAIGHGLDLIRLNRADIMLAGAADPFSRISFTGFNQFKAVAPERCQPFDKNRKGMMVAEGSAVLVIEPLDRALSRNAPIYAEILGYGLSCDAYHMTQPSVEGVTLCMKKALDEASVSSGEVDYVSAHGTGTPANDKNEAAAVKEIFSNRRVPISSIKSMLGHAMGAASALEAAACALAVKNNQIPPTINYETPDPECDIDCVPNHARSAPVFVALNNSYAFGGNNASLVIKKFIA